MIPTSDLRKGNLIRTEYGILPIHAIVWDEVQVKGKDGRVLWAKDIAGVELTNEISTMFGLSWNGRELSGNGICLQIFDNELCYSAGEGIPLSNHIGFAHELQNLFYWIERKELNINE